MKIISLLAFVALSAHAQQYPPDYPPGYPPGGGGGHEGDGQGSGHEGTSQGEHPQQSDCGPPRPLSYCVCKQKPGAQAQPTSPDDNGPYASWRYSWAVTRIRFVPLPQSGSPQTGITYGWDRLEERLTDYEWMEEGCSHQVIVRPDCNLR